MNQISVIGAGTMGAGIAQLAATYGHQVVLIDMSNEALEKAKAKLQKILARLVEKGKISNEDSIAIFGRHHFTTSLEASRDSDLIIEAIVENLEVKKSLFQELEGLVSEDCILASNTSSLSISAIASALALPQRFIGLHFFNPAPLMKLVEIIPALQTDDSIHNTCRDLMENWGKVPVKVQDTPGFIVNRVARPFYGEALRILEEGIADVATIDWAMTEIGGFRMGPFTLMDFIGNDVNYTITKSVFDAFYQDPRYKPSHTQKRLADSGRWGRKSGRGYYDYRDGSSNPEPIKDERLGNDIVDRIVTMLINEAADAVFWQVASAEDIDKAMTIGVNYPKGLLKWADEWGISAVVDKMDVLHDRYRESRYRCSPLLRDYARNGQTFYS